MMVDEPARAGRRVIGATVTYGDRAAMCERAVSGMLAAGVLKVVIVDNGSTPASSRRLRALRDDHPDRIILRRFSRNEGSAPAFCEAFELARALDPTHLWLLDDDNLPVGSVLPTLLSALEEMEADGWSLRAATPLRGSSHLDPDGSMELLARRATIYPPEQRSFCGVDISLYVRRSFGKYRAARRDATRSQLQMPYAPWGGLLLPWDVVETVGVPMSSLVLYGDDLEYTSRITRAGGIIRAIPEALIVDMDVKWIPPGRQIPGMILATSKPALYYTVRNRLYREFRTGRSGPTFLRVLNALLFGVLLLGAAARRRRFSNLPLILRACIDGVRGRLERRVELA